MNALGRKEVICSLNMWCSLNSTVGECSVSTGKREILLPPWLEVMVNLNVFSLSSKRLTSVERTACLVTLFLGYQMPKGNRIKLQRGTKKIGVRREKTQKR